MEKDPNYCHDDELRERGARLGLIASVINKALSLGEGMYNAFDAAEQFLISQAEKRKENKLRQQKSRLSKNQKKEILKRHGK